MCDCSGRVEFKSQLLIFARQESLSTTPNETREITGYNIFRDSPVIFIGSTVFTVYQSSSFNYSLLARQESLSTP